jgi:hypothetical protein
MAAGVVDMPATSASDPQAVQVAFNIWFAECGRELTGPSRVLALSTGPA